MTDNATKSATKILTENLGFTDQANTIRTTSLTEDLGVTDHANAARTASLTENLGFTDLISKSTTRQLTENLATTGSSRSTISTKVLTEGMGLFTIPTSAINLAPNQILVNIPQTSAIVNMASTQLLVVTNDTALSTITIPSTGITGISLNYSLVKSANTKTLENGLTILVNLDDSTPSYDAELDFTAQTQITGPQTWDGVIVLPTYAQTSLPAQTTVSGATTITTTFSQITLMDVGLADANLSFNKTVAIRLFDDGNGQGFVGFMMNPGSSTATFLPVCSSPSPTLVAGQACYIEEGSDLVIYTTHFTRFGNAKATTTTSTQAADASNVAGRGIIGVKSQPSGTASTPSIPSSSVKIVEISYDVCKENMAKLIVLSTGKAPLVTIRGIKSGLTQTKLIESNPYNQQNRINGESLYVFEAPISKKENYLYVSAKNPENNDRVLSSTHVSSCKGTPIFNVIKKEPMADGINAPRIFDVKVKLDNHTLPKEKYIDTSTKGQVSISSIIYSPLPIKQVEARLTKLGQSLENYTAIKMNTVPIKALNNTYFASVNVGSKIITSPGLSFWIHAENNEQWSQSTIRSMGVKKDITNVSMELDLPQTASTPGLIKANAYVTNKLAEPVLGTAYLIVNDSVVSSSTVLLKSGQTKIDLNWNLPANKEITSYQVKAKLQIYDYTLTTESLKLVTHPQKKQIPITKVGGIDNMYDKDGTKIAEVKTMYASNHKGTRLYVLAPEGTCVIGSFDHCLIKNSTRSAHIDFKDVVIGGQVYRVRYSGPDNVLERFSITTIDNMLGYWKVYQELPNGVIAQAESPRGIFPEAAAALDDIYLKLQYKSVKKVLTQKLAYR
jgi:hypothetical protein